MIRMKSTTLEGGKAISFRDMSMIYSKNKAKQFLTSETHYLKINLCDIEKCIIINFSCSLSYHNQHLKTINITTNKAMKTNY